MPIVAQDGTATLDAYFRNSSGQPIDATSVVLIIRDLSNVVVAGPVVEPAITNPTLGYYVYEWDTTGEPLAEYVATWTGVFLGADLIGTDQVYIVAPGTISTGPLDFLQKPDDYAAIREVLGLQPNELDLGDEVIERLPFGPQAERLIKDRVSNWLTQMTDLDKLSVLRTAAIYATAALLTEAWVTGGTIGLVRPREARDWEKIAGRLWDRFNQWIQKAEESDTTPATFALAAFRVSGPTSKRLTLEPVPPWWDYPPLYGNPPLVD